MFAVVESGSITSMPKGNKGIQIGDIKYSADIFTTKWTESQRNAIGVYTVEIDETNKKDEEYYINTEITYAFGSGKVTGSYGTATAKAHADTKWTQKEIDDGDAPAGADTNTVKNEGLKTQLIRTVKAQAQSILNETDWYVTRKAEEDIAIPSSITTHRKAVRTKQAEMETSITNAADTAALETLYTRNDSGVRPLGDLPILE
tara:strand:- start:57 stop:665 length:609 start_codon:yes stop_codon:yes gene_type:complete